ncbi:MAG: PAS domain-containing protein, partial [Opitutaceae bacterium]
MSLEPIVGPTLGYVATIQIVESSQPALPDSDAASNAFALLAERGAVGLFDLDFEARRFHFSPAWKALLGYGPADLPDTLETWHRLIHPDDSAAAPDRPGRKLSAGSRPFTVEFRMRHQSGRWIWIQSSGLQIVNERGELGRVVGLHLDVTERKELEDAALASDSRLQDLSGAGPLAAFELDFAHQNFWFSPAWFRLLGYSEDELAATPASFAAALPESETPDGIEAWLLARAPGQPTFLEPVRLRTKTGSIIPVLLGISRAVSRKRELARVVGFACPFPAGTAPDEDALPAALLTGALATIEEAVIVTDPRGEIVFLNATAARLLYLPAGSGRGQLLGDVFRPVNRQTLRLIDDPVGRALSADHPLPLTSEDALLGNEKFSESGTPAALVPIVWAARAVFGPDAAPRGVVIVFRNPEEMTLTPNELLKANRFESLGLLASGIAHDFNNLLTKILGAVSLAKDSRDYSALGEAEKACLTAKGLTKQLLSFARGEVGAQTVCGAKELLDDSVNIATA